MASGFGMHGGKHSLECSALPKGKEEVVGMTANERIPSPGVGRCFPFWQDVMACYVVNTSAEDDSGKKKCAPVLEDYYECLHHKKEVGYAIDGSIDSL
jgi:hypothetical protein